MAGERKVPIIDRMNYFDGLFLSSTEFRLEQNFHVMTRRYLNYLLFNAGVLYTSATEPLHVTVTGGANLTISAGAALIRDERDPLNPQAHEVHLNDTVALNLEDSEFALSDGAVIISVGYAEEPTSSLTGGGTGVLVTGDDRLEEQAVIHVRNDDASLEGPVVELASLIYHSGSPASITDLTDKRVRGGIRLGILSQELIDFIGSGTGPATLTGIEIDQGSSLSINLGSISALSVTGAYSDSTSRPIPNSDLTWSSDNPGVATVLDGTVNGQNVGTANISAEHASGSIDTIAISVVSTVPPPVINPSNPFDPQTQRAGFFPVRVFGSNFAVDDPNPPKVTLIAVNGEVEDTTAEEVILINDGEIHFRVPQISTALPRINMRIKVENSSGGTGLSPESGPFFRWRSSL